MPDVRKVTLYCLVVFGETGTPRVWCYNNTTELIDAFTQFRKDSSLYPYTFSKDIFVTSGHPLFNFGVPVPFNKVIDCK